MESSFVAPEQIAGDTQEQHDWAVHPDLGVPEEPFFEEEPEPVREDPDPFAGFDPQVRQDVVGLEHLGYLEDEFSFCGHHFVIKTLHGDEDLASARAAQPYRGTLKEPESWIWAQVAVCLKAVDGDHNFCPPIGPDIDEFAKARYRYVTGKWFYPLVEYIYFQRLVPLQERQVAAFQALQGK